MKKNTDMHFEEESIIYIWSKFQLDTYMFDSNILLTKFGSGFWSRVPGVGPGLVAGQLLRTKAHDINKLCYVLQAWYVWTKKQIN